ncbi:MAG: PEP/pyruvate-binding domain-containing protein [Treponema sp.]|nr:PEP/pyruvate-binding domain-containing protein [Treponema sp.]MCL2271481.1 PEP/pyruvate-binding domain-containing protein [Treponema sp.]
MSIDKRVSTGLSGLDQVIDQLRLGDNVVWQVQSIEDYLKVVRPYIEQSKKDGRRLVYFRFGNHEPILEDNEPSVVYKLDASVGFEGFATKVHDLIDKEGLRAFYVFDCLSDLLEFWYSDLMIGNFFRVTCPFLYILDTVAYFALIRGVHTHSTIARIRETTQLLLDLYNIDEKIYIHPLKVWERYSPTMFFPHFADGEEVVPITSSAEAASLFSGIKQGIKARDYWDITLEKANNALNESEENQSAMKKLLISLMIGREPRITELAESYFSLRDILDIASREIGSGFIGGKSVGMLLGRKVVEKDMAVLENGEPLSNNWEPHDSWFLGSDIFYTYIVQNDWWELRCKQKTPEGYFEHAHELKEKLLKGKFPHVIREQFYQMMEHFGWSPIIVRSSSLLEDNFGNAFAGKYESIFCANQGQPEERFEVFVQAVRTVYASAMSEDALVYRQARGLANKDEQMAILVQRVSGDHYNELFFPHIAGVGHSTNLYVWNKDMDPKAGMLRLVFGLGTRAVDRVSGDYARLVPLDQPEKGPPVHYGEEKKISQHKADVLNLRENIMTDVDVDFLFNQDLKTHADIFFTIDRAALARMQELRMAVKTIPSTLDFRKLLAETTFPAFAGKVMSVIEKAYNYPVDIEFTANFNQEGNFKFNLLQCRPLQTKRAGKTPVETKIPKPDKKNIFFSSMGNFMGGNVRLSLDYVIFVKAEEYLALFERGKYQTARTIGLLNQKLKGSSIMLIGPGRWGTTTPSLGVPVHFSELCNMAAMCEVSYKQGGLMPELSFGSHFFQDIVEADIFYAAIFNGEQNVFFNPEKILNRFNMLNVTLQLKESSSDKDMEQAIHLAQANGLTLYSDITSQEILCAQAE